MKAFNNNQENQTKDKNHEKNETKLNDSNIVNDQAYNFSNLCAKFWSVFLANKNYITPKNITAMIVHESGIMPKEFAANFEELYNQILRALEKEKPSDEQIKGDVGTLLEMNRIRVRNLFNFIAETDFELKKPKIHIPNLEGDGQPSEKPQVEDKKNQQRKNKVENTETPESDDRSIPSTTIESKFYKGEAKFDEEIEEIRNKHKADIALGNLNLDKKDNRTAVQRLKNEKFDVVELTNDKEGGQNGN